LAQIGAFRINAGQSPAGAVEAEQALRIGVERILVVLIHVPDDVRLVCDQGRRRLDQHGRRFEPADAAEAGDQMGPLDRHSVEMEILELGVAGRGGMAGQIAAAVTRLVARAEPPLQGHPLTGERILALGGAVEQQGSTLVVRGVPGVIGQVRQQQQRRASVVGRDVDQGHVGRSAGLTQQSAQGRPRHRTRGTPHGRRRIFLSLSGHHSEVAVVVTGINRASIARTRRVTQPIIVFAAPFATQFPRACGACASPEARRRLGLVMLQRKIEAEKRHRVRRGSRSSCGSHLL
jgi:hypothetical protein